MLAAQVNYAMSNMVITHHGRNSFIVGNANKILIFFPLRVSHLLRLVAFFSVSPHSSPEKLKV